MVERLARIWLGGENGRDGSLSSFRLKQREEREMWAVAALKRVRGVLRACCGARWSARPSVGAEGRCGGGEATGR